MTATARKPHLKTLHSALLPAGRVRFVHVFFPALAELQAGNGEAHVWAVRSRDEQGEYTRMRLFHRVEIQGPSWSHLTPDKPLPGTKGRGVAPLATRAAIRVFWLGDPPRTQRVRD
jgi:hypothetical protein